MNNRALTQRPWLYDNQMIVLQPWRPGLRKDDPSFRKGLIWIRINRIPNNWLSKEVGWKIGKLFSKCLNVILSEYGSKAGRWLKLFVEIELDKPLMRGTYMKLDDEHVWVEFTYEYIPAFLLLFWLLRTLGEVLYKKN